MLWKIQTCKLSAESKCPLSIAVFAPPKASSISDLKIFQTLVAQQQRDWGWHKLVVNLKQLRFLNIFCIRQIDEWKYAHPQPRWRSSFHRKCWTIEAIYQSSFCAKTNQPWWSTFLARLAYVIKHHTSWPQKETKKSIKTDFTIYIISHKHGFVNRFEERKQGYWGGCFWKCR